MYIREGEDGGCTSNLGGRREKGAIWARIGMIGLGRRKDRSRK